MEQVARASTSRLPARGPVRFLSCTILFVGLTLLVHARVLAGLDETGLRLVATLRPVALAETMNWTFRLGYVQVDVALALALAVLSSARRRSLLAALPPLTIFIAIGIQGGLRLVVDQPLPGDAFGFDRSLTFSIAGYSFDKVDAVARETFTTAAAAFGAHSSAQGYPGEPGNYPSGHAARILFLILLLCDELRSLANRLRWMGWVMRAVLVTLAFLVGYSALYFGYHWPSDALGGYLLALITYQFAAWLRDDPRLGSRARRWALGGLAVD